MTIYTVVDEGYDVSVYRSVERLVKMVVAEDLCLADCERPATAKELREALKNENIVRLYAIEANDWTYKIEKQTRIL